MIARSHSETVALSKPFLLNGIDRPLPAGDYRVVTDDPLHLRVALDGDTTP